MTPIPGIMMMGTNPPDPAGPTPSLGTMPTDGSDTSYGASQANIKAHSMAQVRFDNDRNRKSYLARYVDWVANMTSGKFVPPDWRTPPPVPMLEVLAPPDANGYQWPMQGSEPMTFDPPLTIPSYNGGLPPVNTAPNHIAIGNRNGDTKWFNALPGDTFPNGMTTPPGEVSADGVVGAFEKFGSVASPGWYLLTS